MLASRLVAPRRLPAGLLAGILALGGCATAPTRAVPASFTYAPPPGAAWVRTVKLRTETSVPGTSFRQLEEREFVWNVRVSREGGQTLVRQQLQRLAVRLNGADVLDGERAPDSTVSVDLLVDDQARVTDVRGTDQAATLLSALARPGSQRMAQAMLSPDLVRQIAVARFDMQVRDLVGHPTAPGSTWTVPDADPAVRTKTLSVDALSACGAATCARVTATYDVKPRAGAEMALRSAAEFLARNGVDPQAAEVADATLKYEDAWLVEPATLVDHGASFSQTARVVFAGRGGQALPVEFRNSLEQSSEFPAGGR